MAFTGLAPPAARWRHRPTRRVAAVAVAVLVLLGLLAVGAYARLRPGPVTQLGAGVGCFAKASLRSDVAVVELKGVDPIAHCQEVWASGGMGKPRPAPPLVACVYPSGALAVLPGKDTAVCDRLGLREPAAGELDRLRRFDAMQQAVTQRLELLHSPASTQPPPTGSSPQSFVPTGSPAGGWSPIGWTPAAASSARLPRWSSTAAP